MVPKVVHGKLIIEDSEWEVAYKEIYKEVTPLWCAVPLKMQSVGRGFTNQN